MHDVSAAGLKAWRDHVHVSKLVFKGLIPQLERPCASLVTQELFEVNDYLLLLGFILFLLGLEAIIWSLLTRARI